MHFGVKLTIVAIIAGITVLNGLSKKTTESEIILDNLEVCGIDTDSLDDYQKEALVNLSEAELYQVCEHSIKTQELLRQQQEVMDTLNSININQ